MTARRSRSRSHEPTLVPLADMLTNTVGIFIFILIFIVLSAGSAADPRNASNSEAKQAQQALQKIEDHLPAVQDELNELARRVGQPLNPPPPAQPPPAGAKSNIVKA